MVFLFTLSMMLCFLSLGLARPIPRATDFTGGTGQGTYYDTGLTSCGQTYTNSDLIVALSHLFYDSYPGATANPNDNPVCGKKLTAHYQGKSVTVTVADRCTGCAMYDLDFTPTAFEALADLSVGRISGVTWAFDDSTAGTATGAGPGDSTTSDADSNGSSDTDSSSSTTESRTEDSDSSSGSTVYTDEDSASAAIADSDTTVTNTTTAAVPDISPEVDSTVLNKKRRLMWGRDLS